MPPVRKDTAPAEGGRCVTTRVASGAMARMGSTGKAIAMQQDAHVAQECAWQVSQGRRP